MALHLSFLSARITHVPPSQARTLKHLFIYLGVESGSSSCFICNCGTETHGGYMWWKLVPPLFHFWNTRRLWLLDSKTWVILANLTQWKKQQGILWFLPKLREQIRFLFTTGKRKYSVVFLVKKTIPLCNMKKNNFCNMYQKQIRLLSNKVCVRKEESQNKEYKGLN